MNNLDIYKQAFIETFEIEENELNKAHYKQTHNWDSIGHVNLVTALEEKFDIMIDPDDIIDIVSYEKGIKILKEKYNVEF